MKKIITLCSLVLVFLSAHSQTLYFKGVLSGAQQVPAVNSTASGIVIVKYDTVSNMLSLHGDYKGLAATINGSHIHDPAAPGSNAPVIIPLRNSGDTTGTLSGDTILTQQQEADLLNGLMYVNVHNAIYPGGEIRAQLMMIPDGQAAYFQGRLQGAQQVPPNGSGAMGSVHVLVDKSTDSVFLTGDYHGLTAPANGAHIHNKGIPGVNGPIIAHLIYNEDTSGVLELADTISADNIQQMIDGAEYVNVHDSVYPDGEIRGQLTQLKMAYFFKAMLQGSQQVPPVASSAMGTIIVKYDPESREMKLIGDYQGIADTITGSHIHGPAAPGQNAPVIIPLDNTGGRTGVLSGTDTLTEQEEMDMLNGLMYVNVHNDSYPNGEIRGQLTPVTGQGFYFTGNLQGAQQVPANASAATGKVTALLDDATDSVWLTGNYTGLTDPAEMGHIHRGAAGTNGPVIVPLSVSNQTYGTITGTSGVSAMFADSMKQGYTYVNIHNATYPGGEIRAQLGDLVLPVRLVYFNGYKSGSSVSLKWQTAQEINLLSFEVQQLNTSGNWVTKATVAAQGVATGSTYSVIDVPQTGTGNKATYRLKMTDANGAVAYSTIISVVFNGSNTVALTITPNPVRNGLLTYVITGLQADARANVRIIDFSGRTVATATVSALQTNHFYISNLPSGLYKLVVNVNGVLLNQTFSKQ